MSGLKRNFLEAFQNNTIEPPKLHTIKRFAISASNKLGQTNRTLIMNKSLPDSETYARSLVSVIRRWCPNPLEVAKAMVRILECS